MAKNTIATPPARKGERLAAILVAMMTGLMDAVQSGLTWAERRMGMAFKRNTNGNLSLVPALAIVGVIVGAIIVYLILAALFPTFAGAVGDLNENVTNDNVTFGDETTDTIKPVFAIVIGLSALLGIVGIALAVWSRVN